MEQKKLYTLKVDQEFKNLIFPLTRKEYTQLESNLMADGCRDPLVTWNGYIVDGHNRYKICRKHRIPFAISEMDFSSRDNALAWICANQLGRRNISEETRRYLIGKQYETEKRIGANRNPQGINQYSHRGPDSENEMDSTAPAIAPPTHIHTAERIARENNVSRNTVEKYAIYSKALDTLSEKSPAIVPKILSGQYKISQENVVKLSKLTPPEIKHVEQRLQKMQDPFVQFHKIRRVLDTRPGRSVPEEQGPSVKDMPAFDPDADINGLALTVPSWSSSIVRVLTKTDLSIVSKSARASLIHELHVLTDNINELLSAIEES